MKLVLKRKVMKPCQECQGKGLIEITSMDYEDKCKLKSHFEICPRCWGTKIVEVEVEVEFDD